MIDKTEQEIMENWKAGEQMMVNVACLAFNHENYIAEALDSFLMQETSFPFEIFINDDVSTDRTVEILKQYKHKYPNIVKPVYQSENQFSQGINPMALLFPQLKGKYVALCEGDDFWTDKKKLQIQVDQMEREEFSEVDLCFHPAYELVDVTREVDATRGKVLSKHSEKNKIFTPQEIILGGGNFCPTASLLLRSRLISSLSDWFYWAIPGDYLTQIIGSVNGGALYINRCMSIYRVGNAGSWTSNQPTVDSEKKKKTLIANVDRLKQINNILNNKFQKEFNQAINEFNYSFIINKVTDLSIKKEVYNYYREGFSMKQKILWYLIYRNNKLRDFLSQIKNRFSF